MAVTKRVTTLELNLTSRTAKTFMADLARQADNTRTEIARMTAQLAEAKKLGSKRLEADTDASYAERLEKITNLPKEIKKAQDQLNVFNTILQGNVKNINALAEAIDTKANMSLKRMQQAMKEYQQKMQGMGKVEDADKFLAYAAKLNGTMRLLQGHVAEVKRGFQDVAKEARAGLDNVGKSLNQIPNLLNVMRQQLDAMPQAIGSMKGISGAVTALFGDKSTVVGGVKAMKRNIMEALKFTPSETAEWNILKGFEEELNKQQTKIKSLNTEISTWISTVSTQDKQRIKEIVNAFKEIDKGNNVQANQTRIFQITSQLDEHGKFVVQKMRDLRAEIDRLSTVQSLGISKEQQMAIRDVLAGVTKDMKDFADIYAKVMSGQLTGKDAPVALQAIVSQVQVLRKNVGETQEAFDARMKTFRSQVADVVQQLRLVGMTTDQAREAVAALQEKRIHLVDEKERTIADQLINDLNTFIKQNEGRAQDNVARNIISRVFGTEEQMQRTKQAAEALGKAEADAAIRTTQAERELLDLEHKRNEEKEKLKTYNQTLGTATGNLNTAQKENEEAQKQLELLKQQKAEHEALEQKRHKLYSSQTQAENKQNDFARQATELNQKIIQQQEKIKALKERIAAEEQKGTQAVKMTQAELEKRLSTLGNNSDTFFRKLRDFNLTFSKPEIFSATDKERMKGEAQQAVNEFNSVFKNMGFKEISVDLSRSVDQFMIGTVQRIGSRANEMVKTLEGVRAKVAEIKSSNMTETGKKNQIFQAEQDALLVLKNSINELNMYLMDAGQNPWKVNEQAIMAAIKGEKDAFIDLSATGIQAMERLARTETLKKSIGELTEYITKLQERLEFVKNSGGRWGDGLTEVFNKMKELGNIGVVKRDALDQTGLLEEKIKLVTKAVYDLSAASNSLPKKVLPDSYAEQMMFSDLVGDNMKYRLQQVFDQWGNIAKQADFSKVQKAISENLQRIFGSSMYQSNDEFRNYLMRSMSEAQEFMQNHAYLMNPSNSAMPVDKDMASNAMKRYLEVLQQVAQETEHLKQIAHIGGKNTSVEQYKQSLTELLGKLYEYKELAQKNNDIQVLGESGLAQQLQNTSESLTKMKTELQGLEKEEVTVSADTTALTAELQSEQKTLEQLNKQHVEAITQAATWGATAKALKAAFKEATDAMQQETVSTEKLKEAQTNATAAADKLRKAERELNTLKAGKPEAMIDAEYQRQLTAAQNLKKEAEQSVNLARQKVEQEEKALAATEAARKASIAKNGIDQASLRRFNDDDLALIRQRTAEQLKQATIQKTVLEMTTEERAQYDFLRQSYVSLTAEELRRKKGLEEEDALAKKQLETNHQLLEAEKLRKPAAYGVSELQNAIKATEQLRDTQARGSKEWKEYNQQIETARNYLQQFQTYAKQSQMTAQFKGGVTSMSDAALADQKKYWTEMVANTERGTRLYERYAERLREVTAEEQKRADVVKQKAAAEAEAQRASVMSNVAKASVAEIQNAIKATEQLRDAQVKGSREWNIYSQQIDAAKAHLKQFDDYAKGQRMMKQYTSGVANLSDNALQEQKKYWQEMVASTERGSAMYKTYVSILQKVTAEEQKRADVVKQKAAAEAESQRASVMSNVAKASVAEIQNAIKATEQLRDAQTRGSQQWQTYNQQIIASQNYLQGFTDRAKRAQMNTQLGAGVQSLSTNALEAQKKYWQDMVNNTTQGTRLYAAYEARLKAVTDEEQRRANIKAKAAAQDAEIRRQDVMNNLMIASVKEIQDAVKATEVLRDAQSRGSSEWEKYNQQIQTANNFLQQFADRAKRTQMNGQLNNNNIQTLSTSALEAQKKYWTDMVNNTTQGTRLYDAYQQKLAQVTAEEERRANVKMHQEAQEGETRRQQVMNNLLLVSVTEIKEAIQVTEQLRDAQIRGSKEWEIYNQQIEKASAQLKYYDDRAKQTSMTKQFNGGVSTMSDSALQEQKKYWEQMAAGVKYASAEYNQYKQNLAAVVAEEQKRADVVKQQQAQDSEAQRARVMANAARASVTELQNAIKATEQLRDAQTRGSQAWEQYNTQVQAAQAYLKSFDNASKEQQMTLQYGYGLTKLSNNALSDQKKYWQEMVNATQQGTPAYNEYYTKLKAVTAEEQKRADVLKQQEAQQRATDAEIKRASVMANVRRASVAELNEAIKATEALRDAQTRGSVEWQRYNTQVDAAKAYLSSFDEAAKRQQMQMQYSVGVTNLSAKALSEQKKYWQDLVNSTAIGTATFAQYEARLRSVTAEEERRAEVLKRQQRGADEVRRADIMSNINIASVNELKWAIEETKKLRDEQVAGSHEWINYHNQINAATNSINAYTNAEKAAEEAQRKAEQEAQKLSEARRAAAELEYSRSVTMNNLQGSSKAAITEAIQATQKLKDSTEMGSEKWKQYGKEIESAQAYLKQMETGGTLQHIRQLMEGHNFNMFETMRQNIATLTPQLQQAEQRFQSLASEVSRLTSERERLMGVMNNTINNDPQLQQMQRTLGQFHPQTQALENQLMQQFQNSPQGYQLQTVLDQLNQLRQPMEDARQRLIQMRSEMDQYTSALGRMTGQYDGLRSISDSALQEAKKYWQEVIADTKQTDGAIDKYRANLNAVLKEEERRKDLAKQDAQARQIELMASKMTNLQQLSKDALAEQEKFWQKTINGAKQGDAALEIYERRLAAVQAQQKTNAMSNLGLTANGASFDVGTTGMLAQLNDQSFPKTIEWLNKLKQEVEAFKTKFVTTPEGAQMLNQQLEIANSQLQALGATAASTGQQNLFTLDETKQKMGEILANMAARKSPFDGTSSQIEKMNASLKKLRDSLIKNGESTKDVDRVIRGMKGALDTSKVSMDDFKKILAKPSKCDDIEKLNHVLEVVRARARAAGGATAEQMLQMRALDKQAKELNQTFGYHASTLENAASRLKSYIMIYMGFNAMMMKARQAISGNLELADSISNVQKVSGLTEEQVNKLSDALQRLDSRAKTSELMQIAYQGSKMGVAFNGGATALREFTESANKLNSALGEDFGGAEAVGKLTKLTQTMGIAARDCSNLNIALEKTGSAILTLGNNTTANYAYINNFATRLGGISRAANISMPDLLAIGATMDVMGMQAEMSATAITKFISTLSKKPEQLASAIKMSTDDLEEFNAAIGRGDTMTAFMKVFETLNKNKANLQDIANVLKDLVGGGNNTRALQVLTAMANGYQTLAANVSMSNRAFEDGTAIQDEYNIMNENAAAYAKRAGNAIAEIFVNAGNVGAFKGLMKGLADTFEYLQSHTIAFVGTIVNIGLVMKLTSKESAMIFKAEYARIRKEMTETGKKGTQEANKVGNAVASNSRKARREARRAAKQMQADSKKTSTIIQADAKKTNLGMKSLWVGIKAGSITAFAGMKAAAVTAFKAIKNASRTIAIFAAFEALVLVIQKLKDMYDESVKIKRAMADAAAEATLEQGKITVLGNTIDRLTKQKKAYEKQVDALAKKEAEATKQKEKEAKTNEALAKSTKQTKEEQERALKAAQDAYQMHAKNSIEKARETNKTTELEDAQKKLKKTTTELGDAERTMVNILLKHFDAEDLVAKGIINTTNALIDKKKAQEELNKVIQDSYLQNASNELYGENLKVYIKSNIDAVEELRKRVYAMYDSLNDKQKALVDPEKVIQDISAAYSRAAMNQVNGGGGKVVFDPATYKFFNTVSAANQGKTTSYTTTSSTTGTSYTTTASSPYSSKGDVLLQMATNPYRTNYAEFNQQKRNIQTATGKLWTMNAKDVGHPDVNDGADLDNGDGNGDNRVDKAPEVAKRVKDAANDADKAVATMLDSVKTILNRMFALAKDEDNIELQTELQRQIDNIEKRKNELTSKLNDYYMKITDVNPLEGFMSEGYLKRYADEVKRTGDETMRRSLESIRRWREGWDRGDGTRMQSAAENASDARRGLSEGYLMHVPEEFYKWTKTNKKGETTTTPYIDDKELARLLSEILEERGIKADEYLLKASEKDAAQVRKFLEELIKLRPFEQLRSEMSKNVIELGLFDELSDEEISDRVNRLFGAVQDASRKGSDRVVDELRQSGLFKAWNLTPQQEEVILDRITSFSEKYQDVVRQQAQKIKKRLEESMSLNAMRSPLEQLFDQFNIQSSIKAQYNPQIQSAYKQKVDAAAQIQRLEALLAQRGKEVSAAEKADNTAQEKKREEIKTLEALASKLAAEGKKEELQQVQIDLAEARADLHEMTTNLSDVTVTAKANWKKINDQLEAARKAYDGSMTTLDELFRNMARDITKGLADYNKEQQKMMSVAEYKEFAATYFERQKSHYSRQESAGWGGNVMGLTNSDTATFKAMQEQLRVARYEMAELERRKMSDLAAIQKGTGSQEKKMQAMQAKAAEYKLVEVEKQKELNKLELEEIALREEMANKIYQHMQEYSNIVNEYTRSITTAGTMTRGEKNLEKAKFDFQESRGIGTAKQEYVTYKSDGSYETSWMTDREYAEEQRKIERQNAMADAATEALNKMGEKMSEDIMNAFLARNNERQMEKDAEEQAQTEILDAVRTRIDGQISQEQAFTEMFKSQLAERMTAFNTYISQIQSAAASVASSGNVTSGSSQEITNATVGLTGVTNEAAQSSVMSGMNNGTSTGLLSQVDIDNTLAVYMQEQNQSFLDGAKQSLADYKQSVQTTFDETFQITKSTNKSIDKEHGKMTGSMTQAMNLYGAAYSVVMNDNLSATQKMAMFSIQAIGQMLMSILSSAISMCIANSNMNLVEAIGKVFSQLGAWGWAAVGGITAAIGAGMAMATKAVAKSKKEISQATGSSVSAGKLSTGMLTYATGRYNEEEIDKGKMSRGMMTFSDGYQPGQSYSVDGADGKNYKAKYTGRVSDMGTGLVRGTHFGIFSEVKPETVIDGDTTAIIHNKYPFLENAWLQVARTGSLNMQEMLGLDYASIGRTIDTLSRSGALGGVPRMSGFRMPTFSSGSYPYDTDVTYMTEDENGTFASNAGASYSVEDRASRDRLAAAIEQLVAKGVVAHMDRNEASKQLGRQSRFEQSKGVKGGIFHPRSK